jgi:hypothetical protein
MATLCSRFDQGHNLSNHVGYSGMGFGAAISGPYPINVNNEVIWRRRMGPPLSFQLYRQHDPRSGNGNEYHRREISAHDSLFPDMDYRVFQTRA